MLLHGEGGDADPAGARATFDRGCRGGEAAACVFAALTIPDEGGLDESAAAEARAGRLERACALGDDQACERRRDR
jgi:TPR repeat protein